MTDERTLSETNINEIVQQSHAGRANVIMDSQILTTLMSCPRLSDLRFNHNFVAIGGKSNSLEVGSIVHKFLEVYYKSIILKVSKKQAEGFGFAAAELYIRGCKGCTDFSSHPCACTQVIDTQTNTVVLSAPDPKCQYCFGGGVITKPSCNHAVDEYPGLTNTPKDDDKYIIGWQHALDTCAEYLQYYQADAWTPREIERVHQRQLYIDDEIRIIWKAKYDWIGDTLQESQIPMDHKTMKQNRTTLSLNNQFLGQTILLNTNKVVINKIGFQKTLKPVDKYKRDVINYNYKRQLEWQSEILPYYGKLLLMYARNGYFPPNYTHCENKYGFCAFKGVCEAEPDDRERVLRESFKIGKVWNPMNDED